jgi:hypothetical protein
MAASLGGFSKRQFTKSLATLSGGQAPNAFQPRPKACLIHPRLASLRFQYEPPQQLTQAELRFFQRQSSGSIVQPSAFTAFLN